MAISGVKIDGLEGLEDVLAGVGPRVARNLNRSTIHAMAGIVRDDARANAPRDSGTLRKAIKSVRRKPKNPDQPYSDVVVESGKDAKYDAYYWRFVEYGTINQAARPYIQPAVDALAAQVPTVYREEFFKKFAKWAERQAKKQGGS